MATNEAGALGAGAVNEGSKDTSFFGHPKGLAVLFAAEMWERFSYYGMRALLVLYLTQHFLISDERSVSIYAAYAGLVYLLPILGGYVADKYIGARKAVIIGAVLLVAGHFAMAFEGSGSTQYIIAPDGTEYEVEAEGRGEFRELYTTVDGVRTPLTLTGAGAQIGEADAESSIFIEREDFRTRITTEPLYEGILFLALALIIVGVGFLKPSISTMVGMLYAKGDPRRDSGFTIFYMGINLGSVTASLLCGYLGITYGWAYGFGAAGIGMLLGLITFIMGRSWLEGRGEPPAPERLKKPLFAGIPLEALFWIGGALVVLPTFWFIQREELVQDTIKFGGPLLWIAIALYAGLRMQGAERSRMLVALVLTAFGTVFWALFEQAAASLSLFAARTTEYPSILGVSMNAAQTQFFNPGFIILLAPIFAMAWTAADKVSMNPNMALKFVLGLAQVGLGFLVLAYGATHFAGDDFKVPLIWLALAYLLHTTGELCLSPVGLSMITKLSVERLVGFMMGAFFISYSLGSVWAGEIAALTGTETVGGVVVDLERQLNTYIDIFTRIGWIGIAAAGVLLILSPFLKKGMAGVK